MEDLYWQSFMEQAVRLIYFLAESPDQLCSRLLQRSARLLLDQIAEGGEINKDASQVQDGSQDPNELGEQGKRHCVSILWTHIIWSRCFVLSQRTINYMCPCLLLSCSELCVSGPAVGSVWLRGFLAGVSP